jgi:hypothetical protein
LEISIKFIRSIDLGRRGKPAANNGEKNNYFSNVILFEVKVALKEFLNSRNVNLYLVNVNYE